MLENDAPPYREGAPLPGFRPAAAAILSALPALSPHARVTVSEVAHRRKINAGGAWMDFDNGVAPYMVEPQDQVTSRRFDSLIFVGPARCSKTESLVLNVFAHNILAAPRLMALFSMTKDSAREFAVQELEPMIRNSPELAERLRFDNTHDKRFQGGGRLTIDWPVPNKLAARSIPLVAFTDYDAMDQDVGGEGSPFGLGRKRTTSAGSRGMAIAESSPRFPILDDSWTPSTPHEPPPAEGILGLYGMGTRARWYWACRDCGGQFEPSLERLVIPEGGAPAERGAATYMSCLHCGGIIESRHKAEFNRAGQWLHETADGDVAPLGDLTRPTTTLSYWLHGPAAALAPWKTIVTRLLEGREALETTGSEGQLKQATNVDFGLPYRPVALGASAALSESHLREIATDHAWGVAPMGTRFLLAAVDVQDSRFVVQVEAWLSDMERVIIDRFDIVNPPATAPRPEGRAINPPRYSEDWDALLDLFDRTWPVAASDYSLKALSIICDSAGSAGVTPNAYDFYRKCRLSHPRRFHLQKGRGGLDKKRVEVKTPETSRKGRKFAAKDVLLVWTGTDVLKDEVAASLVREEQGVRAIHIPRGAPKEVFAEFAAERRDSKGWDKRPGVKRNEALDLAVYCLGLAISLDVERINVARPPAWARPDASNSFAHLEASADGEGDGGGPPQPKPKARRQRRGRKRSFDGW